MRCLSENGCVAGPTYAMSHVVLLWQSTTSCNKKSDDE